MRSLCRRILLAGFISPVSRLLGTWPLRRVACQQDSAPYQCRDDLLSVETKDSCRKLCVQIHPAGFANPLIGFQYRHGDLLSLLRLTRIDSPVRSLFGIRCCCYMEELNLTMLGCQLELYLPNREHLRNVGKIRRSVCGPQCHVRRIMSTARNTELSTVSGTTPRRSTKST